MNAACDYIRKYNVEQRFLLQAGNINSGIKNEAVKKLICHKNIICFLYKIVYMFQLERVIIRHVCV